MLALSNLNWKPMQTKTEILLKTWNLSIENIQEKGGNAGNKSLFPFIGVKSSNFVKRVHHEIGSFNPDDKF